MNRAAFNVLFALTLSAAPGAFAKLTPEQVQQLPPPATHTIDFGTDIKPILETRCVKCHGRGRSKGDFQLDTRETALRGGASGAAIVPGKSAESLLVELVSGLDPDNVMPQKGTRLTAEQVGLIRAWIDQGLRWDDSVSFAKTPPRNLVPRRPTLPAAHDGVTHPIDLLLQPYFESKQVARSRPVEDRVFARRVYLDVIGMLPRPDELDAFLADTSADKREKLVKRVLADNQRYAEHWLTFWNDVLRNDYKGTGYIDDGRKQITFWLFSALAENLPYDQFVAQLLNPTEDCEGFTKGIVWRGAVNASQTPPLQAAQNISQVFMGVNLKCASCHDSFINDWRLADAYGLANIYSDTPLELFECDKATGRKAGTQFIYPELGTIDAGKDKPARLKQLAELITRKEDGRLSRTIVNRFWQRFFGRGLVEPVDDMEQPAWNQDVLDWLASDLADNGYDLKKTIERVLTSQAYQMPASSQGELGDKEYVFRGPVVRRMSAEEFRDALGLLTGNWYTLPAAQVDFTAGAPSSDTAVRAKWIWTDGNAAQDAGEATVFFRKEVELAEKPTRAFIVAACDNSYTVYINGKKAASGKEWKKPDLVDVSKFLTKGRNVIAVEAVNGPGTPPAKGSKAKAAGNPAGFLLHALVRHQSKDSRDAPEHVMDFVSDGSWEFSTATFENWEQPRFEPYAWVPAADLGAASIAPWSLGKKLTAAISTASQHGRTRAALVVADPLMIALGRPNREQVITTRADTATTLQMLELTNGQTLSRLLQQGAAKLLAEKPASSSRQLIERLFVQALGRRPAAQEMAQAEGLLGEPAQKEGVEDLLWTLAMLPEFQLIY